MNIKTYTCHRAGTPENNNLNYLNKFLVNFK